MIKFLKRFLSDSAALFDAPKCEKSIKRMAMLLAIIALLGASIGIPFTADLTYFGALAVALLFLMTKGGLKISSTFIALYFIILLNVLIVDIPPFFKPMQRAAIFLLLTMVCSSALDTFVAVKFRAYLFRYTVLGLMLIAVLSFFCFFAGINLMTAQIDSSNDFSVYLANGGWFSGLASHSMILGPIATISALAFYFLYQKRTDKIYLIMFFISAMSAVLAASRAALLALAIAIVFNLITGKVSATVRKRMIGILVISALMTIPIAGVAFKGVLNKQEVRSTQVEGLNSRQEKFDYRLAEFKSSPIFGVGFCAIDTNGGDEYDPSNGRIEPGTSHLTVLSMLGITGFAIYLMILYKSYANTKRVNTLHSRFVLSCFVAFFVHAWFEGYVLAAGGFLSFIFWITIGQCIDCPRINRALKQQQKAIAAVVNPDEKNHKCGHNQTSRL